MRSSCRLLGAGMGFSDDESCMSRDKAQKGPSVAKPRDSTFFLQAVGSLHREPSRQSDMFQLQSKGCPPLPQQEPQSTTQDQTRAPT